MAPNPRLNTRKVNDEVMDFETFASSWQESIPGDNDEKPDPTRVPLPGPPGWKDFRFNRKPDFDPRLVAAINRGCADRDATRTAINQMPMQLGDDHRLSPSVLSDVAHTTRLGLPMSSQSAKSVHLSTVVESSVSDQLSPKVGLPVSAQLSTNGPDRNNTQLPASHAQAHETEVATLGYDDEDDEDTSSIGSVKSGYGVPFDHPSIMHDVPKRKNDNESAPPFNAGAEWYLNDDTNAHGAAPTGGGMYVRPGDDDIVSQLLEDEQLARYAQAVELGYSRADTVMFVQDKHAYIYSELKRGNDEATQIDDYDDAALSAEDRRALKIRAVLKWEDQLGITPSSRYTEVELLDMSPEQFDRQFQKVRSAWENYLGEKDRQAALDEFRCEELGEFADVAERERQHNRFDLSVSPMDPNELYEDSENASCYESDSDASDVVEFSADDEGSADEEEDSAVLFKGRGI